MGRWTACSSGSIRAGPVITGTDGLLPASLEERPLERGLAAELTDHQGLREGPGRLRRRVPTRGSGRAAKTVDLGGEALRDRWPPRCRAGALGAAEGSARGAAPTRAAWIR